VILAVVAALVMRPALAQELPTLGEAGGEDLSPAQERKYGEAIMQEVRRDPSYLSDADTSEYINRLGYELVAASAARHIDFEFFIVRDPMINAFALPGGFIGVHSGLILSAQNESELASVMAHEIGHVQQRHIARMLAKQRDSTMIALGSILLALLASRSGQATEAALAVGQAAAIQKQLNFSRDNEREADRVGFQILVDAGFDPRAMATFFTRLQQGTRIYESVAPAYLQTHPLTVERIADMQDRVKQARTHQHADSLDFLLVRSRLRVLQEDTTQNARDAQAYFADQIAHHTAASEVAAQYGLALADLALKQPRAGLQAALAARHLTSEPSAILDEIVSLASFEAATDDSQRQAALRLAHDATARFPLSRATAVHYVELLQRSGRNAQVIDYLRDQLALPHSDPRYYSLLAQSHAALDHKSLQHQAAAEMYALQGATPMAVEQLQLARKAADADFYTMSEIDARLRQLNAEIREQREEEAKNSRGSRRGGGGDQKLRALGAWPG
jgi:predicted Zn-dependent protease